MRFPGATLEETVAHIKEAVELWLEGTVTKDLPEEMEEGKTLVVALDVKDSRGVTAVSNIEKD